MRGILARRQVKKMRETEMDFLGMSAKKPRMSKYDPGKTEIEVAKEREETRKIIQKMNYDEY